MTTPAREPKGPSEFSHGRGLRPPSALVDHTNEDELHALWRVNQKSDDPEAQLEYTEWERE